MWGTSWLKFFANLIHLYINHLYSTSEKLKYIIFADDTNLQNSNSDINVLIKE